MKVGRVSASLLVAASFVLSLAIYFRAQLWSRFDLGFGDRADGLIEISILEHWRNSFRGMADWKLAGYFYPHIDTLGYNDGYLLYGATYSLWRLLADPFQADSLNILTYKAAGFVAAFWLVARTLRWGWVAGCLVAALWTISDNLFVQAGHAQLASVALLPWTMALAIAMVRSESAGRHWKARSTSVLLSAVLGAWLLTSYYMAWFTLFSACIYMGVWSALTGNWRLSRLRMLLRRHLGTAACGVISFAVAIVPFLDVYVPKLRESGGQTYREMQGFLVTPVIDMVNVGPGNYAWGWLFELLAGVIHHAMPMDPGLPARAIQGEHEAGFPVFTFLLFAASLWLLAIRRRTSAGGPVAVELRALAITALIGWALTLQLWILSPWGAVFWLVPGAKGLRVVLRYELWLTLPLLVLMVAAWRDRFVDLRVRRPWIASLVLGVLLAENLTTETAAHLSRSEQIAAFDAVPAPPETCRSFYVVAARRAEARYRDDGFNAVMPHNVDAMFLAQRWGIPTINGFSTFNPPDWVFANSTAKDYDARVARFVKRHDLANVCRLDMRSAAVWTKLPPAAPRIAKTGMVRTGETPPAR